MVVGLVQGLEHAGPGTGARRPPRSGRRPRPRRGGGGRSTPGSRPRVRPPAAPGCGAGSSVTGTTLTPTPHDRASSPVTSPRVAPSAEALGAVAVGGQVAVAEVEPGDPAQPPERLHDPPRLVGQAPAGVGVDGVGQGVHHGVQVGRDVQPVEHGVVAGVDDGGDLRRPAPPRSCPGAAGRRPPLRPAPRSSGSDGRGRGGHRRRLAGPPVGTGVRRRCARLPACRRSDLLPPTRAGCPSESMPPRCSGRPTGVGVFCAGALSGLAARPELDVSAFAVSWRRRHRIAALVPAGVADRGSGPCRPDRCTRRGGGSPGHRSSGSSVATTWCTGPTSWCRRPVGPPG